MTPEQILQARALAQWALDDDITKFPSEMSDCAEDLARMVLALTEQQPEPVARQEVIDYANRCTGLTRMQTASEIYNRFTITRKIQS